LVNIASKPGKRKKRNQAFEYLNYCKFAVDKGNLAESVFDHAFRGPESLKGIAD
jgi:hypothetical protein